LHFTQKWFEWITKQQSEYDICCISGDFLDSSKETLLQDQIQWVSDWIRNFEKPLFTCSGNHDIELLGHEDWLKNIESTTHYTDNAIKTIDGVTIGCCPYLMVDGYSEFDKCDVLLNHVPPSKTKTAFHRVQKSYWGDRMFYDVLKHKIVSPKAVLCGHVHQPLSTTDKINDTVVYNPGMNKKSEVPNYCFICLSD